MDYYSEGSGPWSNQHHASRDLNAPPKPPKAQPPAPARLKPTEGGA
jgi:hypothetical protein